MGQKKLEQTKVTRVLKLSKPVSHSNQPAMVLVIAGPRQYIGKTWPLEESKTIGRDKKKADICIPNDGLSRCHVLLEKSSDRIQIQDLDSTNGSFLNEKKMQPNQSYTLSHNDILIMGEVVLKFIEKGRVEALSAIQMQNQIYMDELCQIHNRLFLDIKGQELFSSSRKEETPLSLAIFDIDFFKKINDQYSHLAGDMILFSLADRVRSMIRSEDVFCRIGGEEFILLLTCDLKSSVRLMDKIRSQIERETFTFKSQDIPLTLSAGVSGLQDEDSHWKDIYDRADQALYLSKKNGRNQVTSK